MDIIYKRTAFEQEIGAPYSFGDAEKIKKLMSPLEETCIKLGGRILSDGMLRNLKGRDRTVTYLVDACFVWNNVNLGIGKRVTNIIYADGQANKELIDAFKEVYGEKNLVVNDEPMPP